MALYRLGFVGFDTNRLILVQQEVHTAQERVTLPKWTELDVSICSRPISQFSTLAPTRERAYHPTFVEPARTAVPIAAKKNSIRHPTYCHDTCQLTAVIYHQSMIQRMWMP